MYIPNAIAKYPHVFLAECRWKNIMLQRKNKKYFDISVWAGIRKSHAL